MIASFSGALLQKGTVAKEVIINIGEVEEKDLEDWEHLYQVMRAEPCPPVDPTPQATTTVDTFINSFWIMVVCSVDSTLNSRQSSARNEAGVADTMVWSSSSGSSSDWWS